MQEPDVVDAVAHHHKAVQTQAEGETVVLLGVDTAVAQNVGVGHAAGEKFHPAGVLTDFAALTPADKALDIQLETRLNKGEKSRTQAYFHIPFKDFTQEGFFKVNQIGNGNVLPDKHAFHLMKHRFMRGIGSLTAEHLPRGHELEGWVLFLFHPTDLNGGGMGAQEVLHILEPEGVLHVPGGMGVGNVQGGEVMKIVLDMRAVENVEAHGEKDVFQLPLNNGNRVKPRFPDTFGPPGTQEGDVRPVGGEFRIDKLPLDAGPGLVDRGGEPALEFVGCLTQSFPLLRSRLTQGFEYAAEFALLAQKPGLEIGELRLGIGFFKERREGGFQLF